MLQFGVVLWLGSLVESETEYGVEALGTAAGGEF